MLEVGSSPVVATYTFMAHPGPAGLVEFNGCNYRAVFIYINCRALKKAVIFLYCSPETQKAGDKLTARALISDLIVWIYHTASNWLIHIHFLSTGHNTHQQLLPSFYYWATTTFMSGFHIYRVFAQWITNFADAEEADTLVLTQHHHTHSHLGLHSVSMWSCCFKLLSCLCRHFLLHSESKFPVCSHPWPWKLILKRTHDFNGSIQIFVLCVTILLHSHTAESN